MKDTAQARDLYNQVMEDLNIPEEGLVLSKQQQLVCQLQSINNGWFMQPVLFG